MHLQYFICPVGQKIFVGINFCTFCKTAKFIYPFNKFYLVEPNFTILKNINLPMLLALRYSSSRKVLKKLMPKLKTKP